jgi:hypothetical protein
MSLLQISMRPTKFSKIMCADKTWSKPPSPKWQRQMGVSFMSDLRPSQHLPGYGGGGAVLLVRKSLHGISPIIDGRHSFGCGGIGGLGGDGGVGGHKIEPKIGAKMGHNIGDKNGHKQASRSLGFGGCVVVEEVGGSGLTAAEGCGMAAIMAMARKKARR